MKKLGLVAVFLINGFYLNAQPELFRVAFTNSETILVNGKTVKTGDSIWDTDTIRWVNDNASLKLYGTTHKKLYLVGKEMRELGASTIEKYLSLKKEKKKTNRTEQRYSSIRSGMEPDIVDDTIFVLDTLQYTIPIVISDKGVLVLHFRQGKTEEIMSIEVPPDNTIILPRSNMDVGAGDYDVEIWVNDESNGWNYPVVMGIRAMVLPERL